MERDARLNVGVFVLSFFVISRSHYRELLAGLYVSSSMSPPGFVDFRFFRRLVVPETTSALGPCFIVGELASDRENKMRR